MSETAKFLGALSLEELVGDRSLQFEAVYREFFEPVWRWCTALGGPGFDAEDAAQEVFLRVHRHHHKFRGDAELSSWIYRITANVVRTQLTREQRHRRLQRSVAPRVQPVDGAFRSVEDLWLREQVLQVLSAMSERDRQVFVAFDLEGFSGKDLAKVFEIKEATLFVWVYRARLAFRDIFDLLRKD